MATNTEVFIHSGIWASALIDGKIFWIKQESGNTVKIFITSSPPKDTVSDSSIKHKNIFEK